MPFVAEKVKQFRCGRCGHQIKTDDSKALTIIKCGKCGVGVEVPAMFDRYLLLARLGRGSSGMVFRARDTILNRDVALKVLHSDQGDKDLATHCLNEARTLAALNHPNVVQVYRIGEYKDQHYIVMELVTGGCAKKYLEGDEPLSERKAIELGMAVADGLNAAHQAGLVHMDVKPGNILLDEDDNPKLIDFGAAQYQSRLKEVGLVGTPYYVAPEAVRERVVDQKSDIYSLGATLFHLVTGHPPFEAETAKEVIKLRLKKPAPSALVHRDSLHERTVEVLAAMLVADPAGRLVDYEAVIDHLGDALSAVDEGPMGTAEIAAAELASVQSGNDGDDLIAALSQVRSSDLSDNPTRSPSAVVAQPVLMDRPKRKQSSSMVVLAPVAGAIVLIVVVLAVMIGTAGPEKQEPPDPAVAIGSPPDTSTTVDPFPDPVVPVEPDPVEPLVEPEPPEPVVPPPPVKPKPRPQIDPPPIGDGPHNSWKIPKSFAIDPGVDPRTYGFIPQIWNQDQSFFMLAKMTDEGSLFYVRMQCLSKPITAFRVDMLGFPPLPKGGPGQASDGTFILHHVKIGKYISKGSEPKWYEISKAYASNNADGFPVENALVDDTKGWAIDSDQVGKHHHAVFVLTEPIRSGNLHVIKLVFDKSDHRPPLRVRVHYTTAEDPAKVTNLLAPPAHLKMESPEPDPDQPETDPKKPKPGQPKPGLKLPSLHAIDFVTLNPGTAQSEKGVELTLNDMDGSITAGNNPGVRDVYTVYAETAIEGVTALRLEALPDDSLPKDGPGWGTGGKFSIVEIEVFAKKKGDPGQPQPIEIKRATADMAIPGKEIGKAIDGKKNTFWLVQGKPGEKRVATLMFEKPIGDKGGTEIVVSLSNGIGLGRFRLMVTSMKDPLRK